MSNIKRLLFSLLPGRDLIFTTTRGGGPGGQHRNKVETAVRLSHPASGVEIKASDDKSQHRNKRIALHRLADSSKFRAWARLQAAMIMQGYRNVEDKVNKMISNDKIKVEYITSFTCDGDGCGKKAKTQSDQAERPILPPGWSISENKHYCSTCRKRQNGEGVS